MNDQPTKRSAARRQGNGQETKPIEQQKLLILAKDASLGMELRENREAQHFELAFTEPPPADAREQIRNAGFRWMASHQMWVKPIRVEEANKAKVEMERLYRRVLDIIGTNRRDEGKGR
jgi:hypothetical protein